MTRGTWNRAMAVAAVLVLAGSGFAAARDLPYSETYDRSFPLAAGGRVSLENINGDVRIEVGNRDEVVVHAVKQADSSDWLASISIDVDAHPGSVQVKTRLKHSDWYDTHQSRVDYTLTVPRWAELDGIELVNGDVVISGVEGGARIRTVNGEIDAQKLTGDVELSTVNGRVNATLDPVAADNVKLTTVNGRLELSLPASASADVTARTVNGRITAGFGLVVNEHRFVGSDVSGRIGGGGARISLRTVNGSLVIRSL